MNILISGSSSYVGEKVLENLNANYFCLINKNSKYNLDLENSNNFVISQIHKINKDTKFDYFFHFAGSSSKQYSFINNFYVSVFIPLKILFNFQIDKVVFLDQAHYTLVKTNFFNGINHPKVLLWNSDNNDLKVIKSFDFTDFETRN